MTAEPPEVAPGQSTTLNILQLDPSRPGQVTTTIWVGCEPDPFNLGRSACNDTTALLQPTSFTSFPQGVRVLGIGPRADYACSPKLFDVLDANDPTRINGTVGQILAVVIGEAINPTASNEELRDLFARIEKQQVQSIFALTRVLVSERQVKNSQPRLDGIYVDGVGVPPKAAIQVWPGQKVRLTATAPDSARERYQLQLPDGPTERVESLVLSWYSSAGRFSSARVELGRDDTTVFSAPGSDDVPDDPVPERRTGSIWAVLRDSRGGQSYEQLRYFVCDAANPPPNVRAVAAIAGEGNRVEVTGDNMASVLDVLIGGVALGGGSYNQARQAFIGDAPDLAPGSYPVVVRGKDCSERESGVSYQLP